MRAVKRWRYYCDFCKKVGGHKYVMAKHEKSCTNNPARVCGVCEATGDVQVDLADLKALIVTVPQTETDDGFQVWADLTDESFDAICEAANNCPACIFAAMRQTGTCHPKFDLKKALKEFWDDYNDSNRMECAY